ncbi:MAG: SDR family oxidoreductase [Hyphomicrobiales bacterium]|nr:SDR family oxidoreductase [Hyphomicrobiales bacterium]
MAGRLDGRVTVVFGAGSSGPGWGNGKAAATLYAREGARVIAVDRDLEAARETAAIIGSEGHEALAVSADVTASAEVAGVVEEAVRRFGRIDVLHNNVGITEMGDPIEATEESWDRVMAVNLKSVFLACKHVLPVMKAQRKGAIVNISSVAAVAINDYPYFSYYASKSGLNHLTRALALRYAPFGIRANAIMPGLMDTPLIYREIAGQYADEEAMVSARDALVPMGFMGDAFDVARAAVFLASDEARYITGVCLAVDGGLSCKM